MPSNTRFIHALRIWLRHSLQSEPSRTLVAWLARHSGGLPARAVKELNRLRQRGGLLATDSGWTVSPTLLGRHAVPPGLDAALLQVRPRLVREVAAFTRTSWSPPAEEFLKLLGKLPMRTRPRGSELIE